MKKTHFAWYVCIGCALLLFCTSGLTVNAFTIYQPYILRQGGLTNAQSSMLITVWSLFSFSESIRRDPSGRDVAAGRRNPCLCRGSA